MAAFRSTCLLFCATVLCGLAASTRIETDLAAEEAAGAVAPSLSVVEPVDRMVREADPGPGKKDNNKSLNKGKGKGKKSNAKKRNGKNKQKKKKVNKSKKGGRKANRGKNGQKTNKGKGKGKKTNAKKRKGKKNQKGGKKANRERKGLKTKKKIQKGKKGRGRKAKKSKDKKTRKGKKAPKRKPNKKGDRKTMKNGKGGSKRTGKQTTSSTIALSCLTTAVRLLKFQKDNVANFLTRHARQQKQNALTTKKSGKKGLFAEPSARLVQAGGGDLKNLSCSGSTGNEGAKQLLNITTRLGTCQKGIEVACTPPTGINQTFMEDCYNKAMDFNKTLTSCVVTALGGADACTCFTNTTLMAEMTVLKTCKGDKEAKMAAKQRNKCLAKVRECNADLTKAGTLQYSCKITTDEMLKTLAQIMNNNATVTAAMAKVKALTGVENAGPPAKQGPTRTRRAEQPQHRQADPAPEIPDYAARHAGHRVRRQATTAKATTAAGSTTAAATTTPTPTCASITTTVTACSAAIINTPAMGLAITSACTIVATTITCTTVEKAALQASVDNVAMAQRTFMAFSISLRSELEEASGTTPTPAAVAAVVAALPGNAGATAAAAGRNRNILRKIIMDRLRK